MTALRGGRDRGSRARRTILIGGAVVAEAVAQAALVALNAVWPEGAALVVILSAVVAVAGLAAVLTVLGDREPRPDRRAPVRALVAVAVAVAVVLVAVGDVLNPIAGAVVAVVVMPLLAGIAVGAAERSLLAPLRRRPASAILLLVVSALALVLLAFAALLLGLFVAGWASALAVWLLTGAVLALLLAWWARLHRRLG